MNKFLVLAIIFAILLLIDIYVFQAVRVVTSHYSLLTKRIIFYSYWGMTLLAFTLIISHQLSIMTARNYLVVPVVIIYFSKLFIIVFLLIDDFIRLTKWAVSWFYPRPPQIPIPNEIPVASQHIPRSDFLMKTALIAGAVPLATMSFGIISGAHDYRIKRRTIHLQNLPKAFDGIKIGQISDIHSGSFFNKTAVAGGVDMLMDEKPDVIFFTGDLVNNIADEVKDYVPIFSKIKAPLGVYSVLGNHDYGDYVTWSSKKAKEINLENLKEAHKLMGWHLLFDEHTFLEVEKEKIAILGIQNWGAKGRFPKYGSLAKAYKGTEEVSTKLLLSHDPSHWDAQVRPEFPDIDVMFAGHTHGMQFGIEIGNFRWSPVQYFYKQWADLYKEDNQYLYVNRGFGYIGYPGRIGILPELTIIELKKA